MNANQHIDKAIILLTNVYEGNITTEQYEEIIGHLNKAKAALSANVQGSENKARKVYVRTYHPTSLFVIRGVDGYGNQKKIPVKEEIIYSSEQQQKPLEKELSQVQVDYYENNLEMLHRILTEKENELTHLSANVPVWVSGNKRKPEIDHYDEPIEYIVRFKGDDPRSGWVNVKIYTAEEIAKINYPDYWEWLDESNSANVQIFDEDKAPVCSCGGGDNDGHSWNCPWQENEQSPTVQPISDEEIKKLAQHALTVNDIIDADLNKTDIAKMYFIKGFKANPNHISANDGWIKKDKL